jgi:hypothetical protein
MAFDIDTYVESFFKLPGPPLKKRWVGEYEAVAVHVNGKLADKLISDRRPYEDPEIAKYRKDNYEPITQGPFSRFLSDLSRVFGSAQVSVEVDDDVVEAFIDGRNFDKMDLRTWWTKKLPRRMILDPNGLLVRWVGTVPDAPNERVVPSLELVLSAHIVHKTDDVVSWKSGERSEVLVRTGERDEVRNEGEVFYIVTNDAYYKLVQYGYKEQRNFRLDPQYVHGLGRLPVDVLGGDEYVEINPDTGEEEEWQKSFVAHAIPFANECVRQWSDNQGVVVTAGFPLREVRPIKCTVTGCKDGWITERGPDDTSTKRRCTVCRNGRISPIGPYGVLVRPEAGVLSGESSENERDMVKFIAPPVDILKFGSEFWENYLKRLEKELSQLFVDEAQSGVAKQIDREGKIAKLDAIGFHLFSVLMHNTILDLAQLLGRTLEEGAINITLPPTFIVRDEDSLVEEIKRLDEAKAPFMVKGEVLVEYTIKRFPGDRRLQLVMSMLQEYDPLFGMSVADVTAAKMSGAVDDITLRRHTYGFSAIKRLVGQKGLEVLRQDNVFELIDDMVEQIMPASRLLAPEEDLDGDTE